MKCSNCNAEFGCGCQKRVSIKGTPCCAKCVNAVNDRERGQERTKTN